jgi:hypothetical protein
VQKTTSWTEVNNVPLALANQVWRAVTSSFQIEIRSYVEKVKEKAEDAQSEIELAKAQADHHEQEQQAKERREASDYRQQLSMWATKYSAAMKDMQYLRNKHAKGQLAIVRCCRISNLPSFQTRSEASLSMS